MRLTLMLLLLFLLPLCAWAQDVEDEDEDGEGIEESIITEVEGRGNKVIVIEELVININAGDIKAAPQGGGKKGLRLIHQLMRMLHGGMGPQGMGAPAMPGHGMPPDGGRGNYGPDQCAPGQGGPQEIKGNRMGPGQFRMLGPDGHQQGGGHWSGNGQGEWQGHDRGKWPGVTDDVHGGMPGMQGGMGGPQGMGMPQGMDMQHHMDMPHNPQVMELMLSIPPDIDPEFLGFIFSIGKLAWGDPVFRDQLRGLVRDYEQGGGEGGQQRMDRTEVR